MNILIAGGFGFVGSRIAHYFNDSVYDIVLGSRFLRNISHGIKTNNIRCIDWQSAISLQNACKNIDVVVHASGMSATESKVDPPSALLVNGVGTALLVHAAINAGVKKFFYFSTAHVYASPLVGNINEYSCTNNTHPYATSHLAGELALRHALKSGLIHGSSLRLSNAFGPPMTTDPGCWKLLVNDLCKQAVVDRKIVLRTSGEQMRDFIPLSAVCKNLEQLIKLPGSKLPNVINICSGRSISVIDMARLVQRRCELVLGYFPIVNIGNEIEIASPLQFTSLYQDSLELDSGNLENELDALLVYCKENLLK